jgi:hypothetical protein
MKRTILILFLLVSLSSCEDILEVTDISNEQVMLLAPLNETVVADSLVNFNWNGVNEAESYLIQVATPNFTNASQLVLDSIIIIDSSFVGTRLSKTLANSTYEWRIKAINSDFETEFSSSNFSVEAPSN